MHFITDVSDDFSDKPVPESARTNSASVLGVLLGFIIVVGVMSVGGGLAGQMALIPLITAVIIGNLFLAVFAAIAGYTGAYSGKSFNILLSEVSGNKLSFRVASLYVPLVLLGWYAIEASIFGSFIAEQLGLSIGIERLLIFAGAILFCVSAYYGFSWLRYVSGALVPLMIIIGLYAIFAVSTSESAVFNFADSSIGISGALPLVVGTWVMGALTVVPDLTRFNRSTVSAVNVSFWGMLLGNSFTILLGAFGAALTRESDPALILSSIGLISVALIFGIANIWTTEDNNIYSASLHVSSIFDISRKNSVIISALIAGIIAVFKPHEISTLFKFLGFLGDTAPALGGIVLTRFWLEELSYVKSNKWLSFWLGWGGGTAISVLTSGPFSYLFGLAGGIIIFTLCVWIMGNMTVKAGG